MHMNLAVCLGAEQHARDAGLDPALFMRTKFIGGYLIGYPGYVDSINKNAGAAIRKMLFIPWFGEAEGRRLHDSALGLIVQADQQVRLGADVGERDGTNFFRALEERRDATDSTATLKNALDLGLVDISQLA